MGRAHGLIGIVERAAASQEPSLGYQSVEIALAHYVKTLDYLF